MTAVYLSHRRPDGSAHVRRLTQELGEPGGGIEVVPGIESVVPGTDIVDAIEQIVDHADVVLAVIGPDWLTDRDEHGRRRLDLATDTVRIELATALRRPGPVIPVLVGGAIMPQPEELPADVATLARRSPIELRDTSWASDVARLRATIVPLGSSPVPVAAAGQKSGRRTMLVIIGVLAVLVAGLAAAALLMNGDDDNGTTSSSVTNDTPAVTSEPEPATSAPEPATTEVVPETTSTEQPASSPTTTAAAPAPDRGVIVFHPTRGALKLVVSLPSSVCCCALRV